MSQSNDRERAISGDLGPIDEAAQEWFWLLSSGNAMAADHARFSAWQDADPRHRATYEELCQLWADIDGLREAFAAPPGPAALSGDRKGPHAAPRSGGSNLRFGRRRSLWGGVAAALAIAAVLVAPQLSLRYQADHLTAVGEQTRVILPDGSLAWLNTATALAVDYREERRTVTLLRGEAHFEVAKDARRPFDVLARAGRSTALGTVFAVRDLGSGATVTVAEGLVEVVSPAQGASQSGTSQSGASQSGGRVLLPAGRQVDYREGELPGAVRPVSHAAMTTWRDGVVAVEGLAFERALAEIDRYRPGRILLWADASALEPVTLRLSIGALDEGLDALAATHGLTVTRVTDYLVILR